MLSNVYKCTWYISLLSVHYYCLYNIFFSNYDICGIVLGNYIIGMMREYPRNVFDIDKVLKSRVTSKKKNLSKILLLRKTEICLYFYLYCFSYTLWILKFQILVEHKRGKRLTHRSPTSIVTPCFNDGINLSLSIMLNWFKWCHVTLIHRNTVKTKPQKRRQTMSQFFMTRKLRK